MIASYCYGRGGRPAGRGRMAKAEYRDRVSRGRPGSWSATWHATVPARGQGRGWCVRGNKADGTEEPSEQGGGNGTQCSEGGDRGRLRGDGTCDGTCGEEAEPARSLGTLPSFGGGAGPGFEGRRECGGGKQGGCRRARGQEKVG